MVNTLSTRSDSGSQRTVARGRGESDHDPDNDQSKDEEYEEELAAGDTYELELAQHPAQLLKGLNELRCDSSLCDAVLRSGDTKLACHRCVISSASVYFKAMFDQKMKEAVDSEVTINGVDCDSLRALLDFIYTGRITITQSNVQSLTSAANLLQKHLDATNSIGIHGFAEAMNCPKLIQVSMQFCHRKFCNIIEHEEFLSLSADKLIQLISSDRLSVVKEEIVFSAVVKWLQHQSDTRKHMMSKVLCHVRLPLMSPYVLHDSVSLLRNLSGEANSDWMALIEEARLYNLLPDRRWAMQNSRTKPRREPRLTKAHHDNDQSKDEEYEQELAAGDTYELEMAQHPAQLLKGLNELRCYSSLCDVVLRSGDTKLTCHRCVLSSASVYFKAMFGQKMKEAVDGEVTINGVDCDSLRALLDFIYTGRITITQSNVQSLTSAANLLQILDVKNACSLFMEKHLDASNSIGIHGFAEAMNCPKLIQVSMQFCLRKFCDIIEHEEFLSLSADKLIQLISSDRLNVVKEEIVFSAVVKWLQHQSDTRKHMMSNVLCHVRLPLMSPYVLQDGVSLLRNLSGEANSDWMALIEEARLYNLLPDRRCAMQNSRTKPRRKSRFTKVILFVGGKCDRVVLQSVEAFHLLSDSWTALDNLPFAISGHCLVVSGRNVVYLLGGEFSASLSSRQVLKFDPVVGVWQEMSPMFVCRSLHGAAVIDGYIYVVGGWDGSAGLSSVERYDIDANEWEKVQSLPHAIYSASVVAHEGFLYVVGGVVDGKIGGVSSLLRYDPRQQCWHSGLASMLAPRRDSAVAVTNQQIFVFGGICTNSGSTNSVECYDIVNNKWRVCAPMKERRHGPGAAVIGDCVYVVGGECDSSLNSVECYNISENTWTDCAEMSKARSWISCAILEVDESFLT